MPQTIIIVAVILGVMGGGYFLLNPEDVYVSPENVSMTEIVIDDGESALKKKFPTNVEEREIINEEFTQTIKIPTSTTKVVEEVPAIATTTEEIIKEEPMDEKTKTLPLGDGNISTAPKVGNVFSCHSEFNEGAVERRRPWIQKSLWYPNLKFAVEGSVSRTNANITFETSGSSRIIKGNGLPLHATGEFPISSSDRAYEYDKNPNSIELQETVFVLPLNPELRDEPTCLPKETIGITLTGVPLFSALDAKGTDALAHELQDKCGGHPEGSGTYHYHGESKCLREYAKEQSQEESSVLVGYALDGFGIYSSVENGEMLTNDDLDSCHGHSHGVLWDGAEKEIYHYHGTEEFPYTLGCFMGTPILD